MTILRLVKQLSLLTLLGFSLYLTWYLNTQTLAEKPIKRDDPQLEIYHFTLNQYTENGVLITRLVSPYLKHYDSAQGTFLDTPHLTRFEWLGEETFRTLWTAESHTAHLNEDSSLITLENDVILHQPHYLSREEETILTEKLLIHEKGEKVSTDLFIQLYSPSHSIEGVGMVGYPNQGSYKIYSKTKSQYGTGNS